MDATREGDVIPAVDDSELHGFAGTWISSRRAREWTFVAGSDELVERLLGDGRLEVARTDFDAPANRAAEPAG